MLSKRDGGVERSVRPLRVIVCSERVVCPWLIGFWWSLLPHFCGYTYAQRIIFLWCPYSIRLRLTVRHPAVLCSTDCTSLAYAPFLFYFSFYSFKKDNTVYWPFQFCTAPIYFIIGVAGFLWPEWNAGQVFFFFFFRSRRMKRTQYNPYRM